jgi:hypothetical protein
MACLFAGNLAGNCDAAVDIWPVIQSSTASVFPASDHRWGLRDYGTPPQIWGGDPRLPAPLGRGAADPPRRRYWV